MTVNTNNVLRLTAVMRLNGLSTVMNVYHVRYVASGEMTDEDAMEFAERYLSDVYGSASGMFSTGLVPVEIRGFNETTNAPLPVIGWTNWGGGALGGETAPAGCAGLLLFRTGVVRKLGRKFLPGLAEGHMTNGVLAAGWLSDALSFAGTLMAGFEDLTETLVYTFVIRGKFGDTHIPIAAAVRADVAYQRRRKPGVGI